MNEFTAESIGTFLLILLGGGVCANVSLKKTAGHNSGWIVITAGWALAVAVASPVAVACDKSKLGRHVASALQCRKAWGGHQINFFFVCASLSPRVA